MRMVCLYELRLAIKPNSESLPGRVLLLEAWPHLKAKSHSRSNRTRQGPGERGVDVRMLDVHSAELWCDDAASINSLNNPA